MPTAAAAAPKTKEKAKAPERPPAGDEEWDDLRGPWPLAQGAGDAWSTQPPEPPAAGGAGGGSTNDGDAQHGRYGNTEVARVATETHPSELEAMRAAKDTLPETGVEARAPSLGAPPPADVQALLRTPGTPLDGATRERMESAIGESFEDVRVHHDAVAARSAERLGARAFASGRHVAFAEGQYRPATADGDEVLRHELAHVAQHQQGGGDPDARPDAISLWPFPPPVQPRTWAPPPNNPPPPPPPKPTPAPPPGPVQPIDLEGMGIFRPPDDVEKIIKDAGGAPVLVPVEFGLLAGGAISVLWNGRNYETPPPFDPDWGGHPIGIDHSAFKIVAGARPVLVVNIRDDVVTGFIGWLTSKTLARDRDSFFQEHPLGELFGWDGLETLPPQRGEINSELKGGNLRFDLDPFWFSSGAFEGSGRASLRNDKFAFDAGFDLNVKGLPSKTRLPLVRDAVNRLFSGKTFRFNRPLGAGGNIAGDLTGTFAGGKVDVRGTLKYSRSKPMVSGLVTVILGSIEVAQQAVRDKLGPDAPSTIDPADPGDDLAVTGWGHVDFAFNEWFTGNAEVIVHPEGFITARGELTPTALIPIAPRKAIEKNLFDASATTTIPGLDAKLAGITVSGSVNIAGYASIGPGTMHDLRVKGLYSTHPGIVNTFEFSGTVSIPAVAGLNATAKAEVGASLKVPFKDDWKWTPISTTLVVKGNLELQTYAEAQATAGRRKSAGGEPEYFVKGVVTAGAGLKLAVEVDFEVDLAVWAKRVPLHNRTYMLGGASVTIEAEYVFGGKPGAFKLKLNKGDFDANKFVDAVMRGETVAEKLKGKQEAEGTLTPEVNPDAPAPPQLGDPSVPAPDPNAPHRTLPEKQREITFKMNGVDHALVLRLSDPPALDMRSVLEPLLKKVRKAQRVVGKDRAMPTEERNSRLAALKSIETSALEVQAAAMAAAKNPAYITPQVSGFDQLAALIRDYGTNYKVTDLGDELAKVVVDPSQPETILKAFPGLQSDANMVAAVEAILEADVAPDTLAKIVLNVKRGWWDGRDKEDVARGLLISLKSMVRTNSSRWTDVVKDLAVGGTMAKGAEFVLRYISNKVGWAAWISFEVKDDPEEGRRWDAWISGELYQFKAWGRFYKSTFLRQMREDLRLVHNEGHDDANLPLSWVFDGRLSKTAIVDEMKKALDEVAATQPNKHGWSKTLVKFMKPRLDAIVKVVSW